MRLSRGGASVRGGTWMRGRKSVGLRAASRKVATRITPPSGVRVYGISKAREVCHLSRILPFPLDEYFTTRPEKFEDDCFDIRFVVFLNYVDILAKQFKLLRFSRFAF